MQFQFVIDASQSERISCASPSSNLIATPAWARGLARRVGTVSRPAGDEGQRLQYLHSRAREDRAFDGAEQRDDRAVGIDDRQGAAMHRFDRVAASDVDEDGIVVETLAPQSP